MPGGSGGTDEGCTDSLPGRDNPILDSILLRTLFPFSFVVSSIMALPLPLSGIKFPNSSVDDGLARDRVAVRTVCSKPDFIHASGRDAIVSDVLELGETAPERDGVNAGFIWLLAR